MAINPLNEIEYGSTNPFKLPIYQRWSTITQDLIKRRRTQDAKILDLYKYYRGDQYLEGKDDEIVVNMTFSNTRIMESLVYYEDPYFRVRPRHDAELAPKAFIIEEALNSIWYAERVGRQIRRCIVDAVVSGLGIAMVGFSDYHDPNIKYKSGKVYVRRVNPLDLYMEDDIEEFGDATFYIRRGIYSTRWLNELYKSKKQEFKAETDQDLQRRRNVFGGQSTQAIVYEIEDLVEDKLHLLSPQHQAILHSEQRPYWYYDGSMYVPLMFVEDPCRLYPLSLCELVEDQQNELNRIRTQQLRHRKRYNRRYLAQEGSIDEAEMRKIEEGEDGVIAFCKDNPNNVIKAIEDAPLDQNTTIQYQQDIKSDIREILGINEYLRSGFVPRTKTAQEASMIQQGSNIRARNLENYVHDFVVDIARRMVLVLQHEYEGINFLRKQMQGGDQFIPWTKEDIAGDYEIEVALGSLLPPSPLPYETLLAQGKGPVGEGSTMPGAAPEGAPAPGASPMMGG